MGAPSGRVLLIGRGDYDSTRQYERLDWVRYNRASWVCKQQCFGIEPNDENSEYWQIFAKDGEQSETMSGASEISDGKSGLVPSPTIADRDKFLRGDGVWSDVNLEEKVDGKGISFYIQNGIPYMKYTYSEELPPDPEIDTMMSSMFDDDPSNDAEPDSDIDTIMSNITDDDSTNDESPYPEIDEMMNELFR